MKKTSLLMLSFFITIPNTIKPIDGEDSNKVVLVTLVTAVVGLSYYSFYHQKPTKSLLDQKSSNNHESKPEPTEESFEKNFEKPKSIEQNNEDNLKPEEKNFPNNYKSKIDYRPAVTPNEPLINDESEKDSEQVLPALTVLFKQNEETRAIEKNLALQELLHRCWD